MAIAGYMCQVPGARCQVLTFPLLLQVMVGEGKPEEEQVTSTLSPSSTLTSLVLRETRGATGGRGEGVMKLGLSGRRWRMEVYLTQDL